MTDERAAAPERPSRTDRADAAARRRALLLRIAGGLGVLILLVVAGLLFLNKGSSILPGSNDRGPTSFSFDLKQVRASPITDQKPAALQAEADEAAEAVKATMDRFYFEAYVDRAAWGGGDYDEAFALVQDPAAASAETDAGVLTLGTTAPQDYEAVGSPKGTLSVVVLTNEEDVAVTAIARVVFRVRTELKGGGATRIVSTGAFFLRPGDEGWSIFAYRVDRNEEPGQPSKSPTAEAS